jgi:hypothetical protein
LLASNVKSDDRPGGVELLTMVPWNAPLPAPGALNVVKVVFRSLAFAERAKPDVARLTANASKSAVQVAVPCNDALFVLLLLFMMFPNRVSFAIGSLQNPKAEAIAADRRIASKLQCEGQRKNHNSQNPA